MKNIYLIIAILCLIGTGCKKEDQDPLIGKWQVTQRSPYNYEQTGSPAFDPNVLTDIKPGYYTITMAAGGKYTSDNTTYINVKSSGDYTSERDNLKFTQDKVNGAYTPYIYNYKFISGDKNNTLTFQEVDKSNLVISIIKMQRVK